MRNTTRRTPRALAAVMVLALSTLALGCPDDDLGDEIEDEIEDVTSIDGWQEGTLPATVIDESPLRV